MALQLYNLETQLLEVLYNSIDQFDTKLKLKYIEFAKIDENFYVFDSIMEFCFKFNKIELAKLLYKNYCNITENCLIIAAENGNKKLLKWAHSVGCIVTKKVIYTAIINGNIKLLKLFEKMKIYHIYYDYKTTVNDIENYEILNKSSQFLPCTSLSESKSSNLEASDDFVFNVEALIKYKLFKDSHIVEIAVENGWLEIINFCFDNEYEFDPISLYKAAVKLGSIDMLNFIEYKGVYIDTSCFLLFNYSMKIGKKKLFDYLETKNCRLHDSALDAAIRYNNIKSVKFCLNKKLKLSDRKLNLALEVCKENYIVLTLLDTEIKLTEQLIKSIFSNKNLSNQLKINILVVFSVIQLEIVQNRESNKVYNSIFNNNNIDIEKNSLNYNNSEIFISENHQQLLEQFWLGSSAFNRVHFIQDIVETSISCESVDLIKFLIKLFEDCIYFSHLNIIPLINIDVNFLISLIPFGCEINQTHFNYCINNSNVLALKTLLTVKSLENDYILLKYLSDNYGCTNIEIVEILTTEFFNCLSKKTLQLLIENCYFDCLSNCCKFTINYKLSIKTKIQSLFTCLFKKPIYKNSKNISIIETKNIFNETDNTTASKYINNRINNKLGFALDMLKEEITKLFNIYKKNPYKILKCIKIRKLITDSLSKGFCENAVSESWEDSPLKLLLSVVEFSNYILDLNINEIRSALTCRDRRIVQFMLNLINTNDKTIHKALGRTKTSTSDTYFFTMENLLIEAEIASLKYGRLKLFTYQSDLRKKLKNDFDLFIKLKIESVYWSKSINEV